MADKARFQHLLSELLTELAERRGLKKHVILDELAEWFDVSRATIESWYRSDRAIPFARVEGLARYIAAHGFQHDRRLKDLLDAAGCLSLLESDLLAEPRKVPQNLPSLGHDNPVFVGRRDELRTLLADLEHREDRLDPRHVPLSVIEVTGPGGVGKTELVLQAAHLCWQASTGERPLPWVPPFRAIIFASAKQRRLERRGIIEVDPDEALRPIRDIYRKIASVLRPGVLAGTPEGLEERVREELATRPGEHPVLLILDNLEVLPVDIERKLAEFLRRPPMGVKIVFTSRHETGYGTRLNDLSEEDAIALLRARADFHRLRNQPGFELTPEQEQRLYRKIGGNPAALIFSMGRLADGGSIDDVLEDVTSPSGDVAQYYFSASVDPLRNDDPATYQLLLALGLFPQRAQLDAICAAAWPQRDPNPPERMRRLLLRSLVYVRDGRYELHALTRSFVLSELATQPTYADEARRRWADFYRDWTSEHGGLEWGGWGERFTELDLEYQNILAVLEWCRETKTSHSYAILRDILRSITNYTSLFGLWSDRIEWLQWLIEAAQLHADPATVVWARADLGWIMTLLGGQHLTQAEQSLRQAWLVRDVAPQHVQCEIALNMANLELRRENYSSALKWTKQAFKTLPDEKLAFQRKRATALYQRGEIHRARGRLDLATRDYYEAIQAAELVSYARLRMYARHGQAEVALCRARQATDKKTKAEALRNAGLLLQECLDVARTNHERRRLALLRRTEAEAAWVSGDSTAFRNIAEDAAEKFRELKMNQEYDWIVSELKRRCENPPRRQSLRRSREVRAGLPAG